MAELMVSVSTGAMQPLLVKLATLMGEEFSKLKNLRKEVKFIYDELTNMKDALEGLSYLDELDPQTKRWRDIVREMSYDTEDIVDDFMQNIQDSNKVSGFVSNTVDRLKTLRGRHKIAGQIEDIKNLVIETNAQILRYKLDVPQYKTGTPLSSNVVINPRISTTNLVGVEVPTNELVTLLADGEKKLKIVSVVGFGGLGKTTLANMVYGRLKGNFDQSAFVRVSQQPDIPKLLHNLLSQLGSPTSHNFELNVLLDKLREYLQNNRYLIVIDDIWDVEAWSVIKCAFPGNNLGSRIIVTTRIQDVAKACCFHGSDHIVKMKHLSNEDSRRLFLDRIFGSEEAFPNEFRDISTEILKRCGGLPLAIISISSMLASEGSNHKERWEHVRDYLGSATDLMLEMMRRILNLCYKDLPPHLKTCFLYLGMYPEDHKIVRSKLERQWMAEGFISKENGKDVENTARIYFDELVNRSLIQPVDFDDSGSVTVCRVHDLVLDLILLKSAEENFFTIVDNPEAITGLDYKIRRLSIRMKNYDAILFPANISMSQVRTVMLFGSCSEISLSECKFLRVLHSDILGSFFTGLPKLYHLRYLHIDGDMFCHLALQASVLKHLETLHVYDLQSDPFHLHYTIYTLLPAGIGNMKSLGYLSGLYLLENTLDTIKSLGELANLRYLVIVFNSFIEGGVTKNMNALCSSFARLGSLQELLLVGSEGIDGMFQISPPQCPYRLQTLRMFGCHLSRVPSWMGELRYLSTLQCRVGEFHDGAGILADLPVLSVLDIWVICPTEMIVFSGKAFPVLKLLKFGSRYNGASYLTFQPGTMPNLQRLEIRVWVSSAEQNWVAPAGLEHLLALKEISISMKSDLAFDKDSIMSTFKNTIRKHPGNPRFEVGTFVYY